MNRFFGNETDTILVNSKGIFLIGSQDREFHPGEYEILEKLPKSKELMTPVLNRETIDSLPEDIFD